MRKNGWFLTDRFGGWCLRGFCDTTGGGSDSTHIRRLRSGCDFAFLIAQYSDDCAHGDLPLNFDPHCIQISGAGRFDFHLRLVVLDDKENLTFIYPFADLLLPANHRTLFHGEAELGITIS